MSTHHAGWQRTIAFLAVLGFMGFSMWMFADKFDGTEWKSLLMSSAVVGGREFWPMMRTVFTGPTQTLARGGQPE